MNVDDITIFGQHDENTLSQIRNCAKDDACVGAVLCADGHLGYAIPVGGVIAYRGKVSPSAVGFDISCGNKAVLTDMPGAEARRNIKRIMDDVWKTLDFGIGRVNSSDDLSSNPLFDSEVWKLEATRDLKQKAKTQLGTIGSGNHYVDVFADEQDRVWIGCHFGSRGFGHGVCTWFLKKGGAKDGMMVDPLVLDENSTLGAEYIECMKLAGEYAYAGRDWVCSKVASILGAKILDEVHNHHNYAWRENINGEDLWVCRKGATPAYAGQKGFVGGSMGDISVILEGQYTPNADKALYSTVHGAGRVMSRTAAAGKRDRKTGEIITPGAVSQEMMDTWVREKGVELRGAGLDESPHCYKRIESVLAEHGDSIRILHTLTPLGVAMAGIDVIDPFKD